MKFMELQIGERFRLSKPPENAGGLFFRAHPALMPNTATKDRVYFNAARGDRLMGLHDYIHVDPHAKVEPAQRASGEEGGQ